MLSDFELPVWKCRLLQALHRVCHSHLNALNDTRHCKQHQTPTSRHQNNSLGDEKTEISTAFQSPSTLFNISIGHGFTTAAQVKCCVLWRPLHLVKFDFTDVKFTKMAQDS